MSYLRAVVWSLVLSDRRCCWSLALFESCLEPGAAVWSLLTLCLVLPAAALQQILFRMCRCPVEPQASQVSTRGSGMGFVLSNFGRIGAGRRTCLPKNPSRPVRDQFVDVFVDFASNVAVPMFFHEK